MKKLFLIAVVLGMVPFLAMAQLFPTTVIPRNIGSAGTNTLFVAAWQQGKQYENTTVANTSAYISAVFVNSNTYILDSSTALCTSSGSGAGPTGTGALIADGTCRWNFSVAGQNIKIPSNYLALSKIETIAGGGGGDNGGNTNACSGFTVPSNCGGAGGGGAYSFVTSGSFAANTNYQYNIGAGGAGGAANGTPNVGVFGTAGGASWFNGASCGAATVCSLGGGAATSAGPGAGGVASGGVGTQTAGGTGGSLFQCCSVGAGGGGAGGPKGVGQAGGNTDSSGSPVGAGGGAGGGGSAGGTPNPGAVVGVAGSGGANWQSTGGGIGAACCNGGFITSFPATENPIAQGSPAKWINGGQPSGNAALWGNVQTNGVMAYGVSEPTQFGDPTAALTATVGSWSGTDQMVTSSVSVPGAQPSVDFQEVELRLNVVISPSSIIGYEFNCSVSSTSAYTTLVRWNGANGNFTNLTSGPAVTCQAGDQLTLANIGGTLYAVINRSGTAIAAFSGTDGAPWTGGSPGVGFYNSAGAAWNGFGETGLQIPTPATSGSGGGGGGGGTPRPGAALAGNGSCGYEFDNGTGGNSLYGAGGGGGGGAGYDTGAAFPAGAFATVAFRSVPGAGVCGGGGGEAGNASDTTGGQVTGGAGGNGFIAFTYTHS